MGQRTNIQWCDSTVNGTTGCGGCELWPGPCYAGFLHEGRLARGMPGLYAADFTEVRLAPGRMAKAAAWPDLAGKTRPDKPWLDGMPRLIFVGDMGDLFDESVPFGYIGDEVIGAATSEAGSRHAWILLTKRPTRAVEFAAFLGGWPENVWMGTSITSMKTRRRAEVLACHPAPVKFLSLEPLWGEVDLAVAVLRKFALAIFGGESRQKGREPTPCDLGWIREGIARCRDAGSRVFVKQLGSAPYRESYSPSLGHTEVIPVELSDSHGGDWSEWPEDLRVREMPEVSHA